MKSIRGHLLAWLLPGFILLWIVAGAAIFYSVRQGLEARLDADLRDVADVIPFGEGTGGGSILSFQEIAESDLGVYFQIWTASGTRILKSESLGQFELVLPSTITRKGEYGEQRLGNGDLVRTFAFRVSDTGGLGKLDIMVAKTTDEVGQAALRLVLAIGAVGIAATAVFMILLAAASKSGLRPLMVVGERAATMNVDSISERFEEDSLPVELKPIVEKLNNLLARIELSLQREKRFSSDLAHELRSPVAALKSVAEVALKWPDEAGPDDYESIKTISEELQSTIENMLTLARLEKEPARVVEWPVEIFPLLEECRQAVAEVADARRVSFDLRVERGEVVQADPKLLRVIVSNLFSNAAEYAPADSAVSVQGPKGDVMLSVTNPAPQLSKDDIPLLFNRLWRHDKSRTDLSHSGLGLSLARACADAMGLELDANMNGESVLVFTLWKRK